MATELGDRYRVIGRLSDGVSTELYRALDREVDRTVVVKVWSSTADAEAIVRGARDVARLDHAAIVPVLDIAPLPDGRVSMIMPFVRGSGLHQPDLDRDARLDALADAADALAYAHEHDVVHGGPALSDLVLRPRGGVSLVGWRMGSDPEGPAGDIARLGTLVADVLVGPGHRDLGEALRTAAVPEPLIEIILAAIDGEPDERPAGAQLAAALRQRGRVTANRDRADELLAAATRDAGDIDTLRQRAWALRNEARRGWDSMDDAASVNRKRSLWKLEDEAGRLSQGAAVLEARVIELAQDALQECPGHAEARVFLAERHARHHAEAEVRGDEAAAARHRMLLRKYDDGGWAAYLEGVGRVTLHCDPPDAEVDVYRFTEQERRLVPQRVGEPRPAPIVDLELPAGSYLFQLRAPGRVPVRYPVLVGRTTTWDGVPPNASEPLPVYLPAPEELGPGECYVPAGWFYTGGCGVPYRRRWLDGFAIGRHPVTLGRYVEFMNHLVSTGRPDEAMRYIPATRGPLSGSLVGRHPNGHFAPANGTSPDWPVVLVNVVCATMYAMWWGQRTGHRYRLPSELQWEKAARGVDLRCYPWGNHFDVSSCASRPNGQLSGVSDYRGDVSTYGVRGLAGNVRDWCMPDVPRDEDEPSWEKGQNFAVRGGSWADGPEACCATSRYAVTPVERSQFIGFRLVRPFPVVNG